MSSTAVKSAVTTPAIRSRFGQQLSRAKLATASSATATTSVSATVAPAMTAPPARTAFGQLGLSANLVQAVHRAGYTQPTPVQLRAIPAALEGRDIMVAAQTGTGKTGGFALPILEKMFPNGHSAEQAQKRRPKQTRVLVLTPTRELAAQVHESFVTYAEGLDFESTCIFGGVGMGPQVTAMSKGVDVLVACPGRLLDLIGQNLVDLSRVDFLVLDEADRMLDMGFIHDVKKVLNKLPAKRQNLLFSATFSNDIMNLAGQLLNNPERIEVTPPNTTVERIEQWVYRVPAANLKRGLLAHLIKAGDWSQALIFTRTKHGANKLAEYLIKQDLTAAAIHGNKSQSARTKALADFKAGDVRLLVATDIAARGLDIDQLPHVVNFELPNVEEDYVHRIGRTGRAGRAGHAISLVAPEENQFLRDIERMTRQSIPEGDLMGYDLRTAIAEKEEVRPPLPPRGQARNSQRGSAPPRPGSGRSPSPPASFSRGEAQQIGRGQGSGGRNNRRPLNSADPTQFAQTPARSAPQQQRPAPPPSMPVYSREVQEVQQVVRGQGQPNGRNSKRPVHNSDANQPPPAPVRSSALFTRQVIVPPPAPPASAPIHTEALQTSRGQANSGRNSRGSNKRSLNTGDTALDSQDKQQPSAPRQRPPAPQQQKQQRRPMTAPSATAGQKSV